MRAATPTDSGAIARGLAADGWCAAESHRVLWRGDAPVAPFTAPQTARRARPAIVVTDLGHPAPIRVRALPRRGDV